MDKHLDLDRHESIASHLYMGDEWDLVPLDAVDLGLPASTREIRSVRPHYNGGLVENGGEELSETEIRVHYEFDAVAEVEAVMSPEDAQSAGWDYEPYGAGLALTNMVLSMSGWVGVIYEGDEVNGGIDYIGMKRADGTVGHPLIEPAQPKEHGPIAPVYQLSDRARSAEDSDQSE